MVPPQSLSLLVRIRLILLLRISRIANIVRVIMVRLVIVIHISRRRDIAIHGETLVINSY